MAVLDKLAHLGRYGDSEIRSPGWIRYQKKLK